MIMTQNRSRSNDFEKRNEQKIVTKQEITRKNGKANGFTSVGGGVKETNLTRSISATIAQLQLRATSPRNTNR